MSKSKQTANEAQLKARRTSLGKKTSDELITIILRKDKSERSMNTKIQELTALLKEADSLNEDKANAIIELNKTVESQRDKINTLIERNDSLTMDKSSNSKELVRLKDKCNILRKMSITCICIIVVLIGVICVL